MDLRAAGPAPDARPSWPALQRSLTAALDLRAADALHQPWAAFTPEGERIVEEGQSFGGAADPAAESERAARRVLDSGMILIVEGGQWIWPGVAPGFRRDVDLYSVVPGKRAHHVAEPSRNVTIETLSLRPLVFSVEGFLTHRECDRIQREAAPRLAYSPVLKNDKIAADGNKSSDFRTSQLTHLSAGGGGPLHDISVRTAGLVRIPTEHQEKLQVLRYGVGEKYDNHYDAMDPRTYANNERVLRTLGHGRNNRLATVFWYLSDVDAGGETIFPRWNGAPRPEELSDFSTGLKVKPRKGKVIVFYNLLPDGSIDEMSLHGACPVESGVKWAANKVSRTRAY